MRPMSSLKKLILLALIAAFLSACKTKETQFFIFYKYDPKTREWGYYKTDLYNTSSTIKLDTTSCSAGDRFITWAPNGNYYICSGIHHQIFFIYDIVNNKVITKSEPEHYGEMLYGEWSQNSQYVSIVNMLPKKKLYYDFLIVKIDGTITPIYRGSAAEEFFNGGWSPNGKYLALEITSPYLTDDNGVHRVLTIFNIYGKRVAQFEIPPDVTVKQIRWSPNSRKLALLNLPSTATRYPETQLYVLDVTNGEITYIISDKSMCVDEISDWSPSGTKILFSAHDCKIVGVPFYPVYFYVNQDGSELNQVSDDGMGNLFWSPDGNFIIIDEYGNGISLMDIHGNNKEKLVDKGHFISWITP